MLRDELGVQAGNAGGVMVTPDRVITEGFPSGWWVQDRIDENTALLIVETHVFPGQQAICLRPRMMKTIEWLPVAREIANALAAKRVCP